MAKREELTPGTRVVIHKPEDTSQYPKWTDNMEVYHHQEFEIDSHTRFQEEEQWLAYDGWAFHFDWLEVVGTSGQGAVEAELTEAIVIAQYLVDNAPRSDLREAAKQVVGFLRTGRLPG